VSATNRGAKRKPGDFYETHAWCVERFTEALRLPGGRWLEPAAGRGAIVRAVNRPDVVWDAVELSQENWQRIEGVTGVTVHGDFLQVAEQMKALVVEPYEVVMTNPPYSLAQEFIEACFPLARHVVMLLRINFLASEARAGFMRAFPPDIYVLPNRPDFTGGGGDSTEYAWFHWDMERPRSESDGGRVFVLNTTPLRVRKPSP
jgi:hypothetical protein